MPTETLYHCDQNGRRPFTAEETAAWEANFGFGFQRGQRLAATDARTAEIIGAGYTYGGKRFSASANHQTWAMGIVIKVQAGANLAGVIVPTIDNLDSHTIADNADAVAIASACMAHVRDALASGSALKAQIAAAQTAEALAAITDNR